MKMKCMKKLQSLFLSMMLIVAMALCVTGCNGNVAKDPLTQTENGSTTELEPTVLGEGKTVFMFTVVDDKGKETLFEIHTDKTIVGEALLELNLIEGDQDQFGLYVKKVNGIVADYDVNQTYWAFYVNGEYAMSGVDNTIIEEGTSYMFKVEK